jgi:hypothetical protein
MGMTRLIDWPTDLILRTAATLDARVFPDFGAVGGSGKLSSVAGALLTIVLVVAVLMLVVSAAAWAICSATGNYQGASRGRVGVLVSFGAAVLAGCAVTWLNFVTRVGSGL